MDMLSRFVKCFPGSCNVNKKLLMSAETKATYPLSATGDGILRESIQPTTKRGLKRSGRPLTPSARSPDYALICHLLETDCVTLHSHFHLCISKSGAGLDSEYREQKRPDSSLDDSITTLAQILTLRKYVHYFDSAT